MKVMDIKPAPATQLDGFTNWMNDMTSKFVSASYVGAKRIPVKFVDEQDGTRVTWYHEDEGEIVTIEKWDGYAWKQFGLDADMTVGDLQDMILEMETV